MISLSLLHSYSPTNVFLIQGSFGALDVLEKDLKESGVLYTREDFPQITIEIAKEIRSTIVGYGEGVFWVLISFTFFTKDARDVLLKLLEEPHSGMHIVLCTPYPYFVPDTIRSRVLFLKQQSEKNTEKEFFSFSPNQKLEYIKKYFATDTEDEAAIRKVEAFILLDEYENILHQKKQFSLAPILYSAKKMMEVSQLPPKQVLEYVVTMLG